MTAAHNLPGQLDFDGVEVSPFDGATIDHAADGPRLSRQLAAVLDVMVGGEWYTLAELVAAVENRTGKPASEAGVSARIRDLRKAKHGAHTVERERIAGSGLYRYRVGR